MSKEACTMTKRNKAIGCLIGLAVGDALGTTVEFMPRDSYPLVTDMVGGGPFGLNPGEWTDDTSMALALADSILEKGTVDKIDLIQKFSLWYTKGEYSHNGKCFDIGITTSWALRNYFLPVSYRDAVNDFRQSGNGSIMRLAPVPIRWHNDYDTTLTMAWEQSVVTHGSDAVRESVCSLAQILFRLINGKSVDFSPYKDISRQLVRSTGYCEDTFNAAMWSVANSDSFNSAVLLAANLGDDADTVAAVTGQIAGALYGFDAIRKDWVDKLAWSLKIQELAVKLYDAGGNK